MTASLPMYDTPVTAPANDRLWRAIRQGLGRGPAQLDRQRDPHETWTAPDLLFSQTCGMPFRQGLHTRVRLIGTPDYGVEGCPPGYYASCIIVRADDPRDRLGAFANACLARNDPCSQSGWAAIANHMRMTEPEAPFTPKVSETGSHAASVRAVAEGKADIASIDAVTWALLERDTSLTAGLRVLCRTEPTPGLPYICGRTEDAAELFRATAYAIANLPAEDRDRLKLRGLVRIPAEAYLAVPTPPSLPSAENQCD